MPIIKLFGDSRSGNCYKPAVLMRLTGQPFEWVETDVMAQQTRSPEFLQLNPNGRVPLLQMADGRCLAESNAMLLHLSHNTRWFPNDPWQQALTWQWLFFEQYSHEPFIAVARFIQHYLGMPAARQAEYESLQAGGNKALSVMEQQLTKTHFLVGDSLTIADIALYAYTHVAEQGGFDLNRYPHIQAWCQRIAQQPHYVALG